MKIYTQTYDIAQPTEQRFWTPPYSDFKIGLKVTNKGEEVQGALSLKAGDAALSAEETEIDGFTIFPTSSAGAGSTVYTLSVEGVPETLKLMQVTTGSTVFEIDEKGSGGGGTVDAYTKAETDALLSVKADNVKQLPADLTSWVTDGWTEYVSTGEDDQEVAFTELTSDFIDISDYGDYTVSAQYVYGWNGWYYRTHLISYCTNGKAVFCHQAQDDIVMDTEYDGNVSGNVSVYFELDPTKVPDEYGIFEPGAIDYSSSKLFAHVSENMDGNAPYVLQQLEGFDGVVDVGSNEFWHNATGVVTPGTVEVSAVYSNEISAAVTSSDL